MCVWEGAPYLQYHCLDAGHVRLPWGVPLHLLAWSMHRHQDAGVSCEDDAAGQDVAEDEECQSVGACCRVLIGQAPVDATGSAVRFWSVLPPVGQRWAGEQQGVDPSTGDEQRAMSGPKPVPWENKESPSLIDIKSLSLLSSGTLLYQIFHTKLPHLYLESMTMTSWKLWRNQCWLLSMSTTQQRSLIEHVSLQLQSKPLKAFIYCAVFLPDD